MAKSVEDISPMTKEPRITYERMHHIAYVVKDHEATRHFYEDILGIPLIAAWSEIQEYPNFPGRKIEFLHTFYGLDNGACIAFFGYRDPEVYETLKPRLGVAHLAIYVSAEDQLRIKARLEAAGHSPFMIDHGFCVSLYSKDPDGLGVEFASEPANREETAAWQAVTAHETLTRWVAGDRSTNNDVMRWL
jgi:catechol 2,3-dioxygenase-like lactoylglutathione lyase family enzyme